MAGQRDMGKKTTAQESAGTQFIEQASSQIKGKIGEYQFIGELLRKNFDVYLPIADIRGIDCVIRSQTGRYVEIQVKTRVTAGTGKEIFEVNEFVPRDNFFFACKREDWPKFWILPSRVFREHSKFRAKYNHRRLILNSNKRKILQTYEDNFRQLEDFARL